MYLLFLYQLWFFPRVILFCNVYLSFAPLLIHTLGRDMLGSI